MGYFKNIPLLHRVTKDTFLLHDVIQNYKEWLPRESRKLYYMVPDFYHGLPPLTVTTSHGIFSCQYDYQNSQQQMEA